MTVMATQRRFMTKPTFIMKLTGMSPLCLTMALGAVAAGSMKAYEQLRVAARAAIE